MFLHSIHSWLCCPSSNLQDHLLDSIIVRVKVSNVQPPLNRPFVRIVQKRVCNRNIVFREDPDDVRYSGDGCASGKVDSLGKGHMTW